LRIAWATSFAVRRRHAACIPRIGDENGATVILPTPKPAAPLNPEQLNPGLAPDMNKSSQAGLGHDVTPGQMSDPRQQRGRSDGAINGKDEAGRRETVRPFALPQQTELIQNFTTKLSKSHDHGRPLSDGNYLVEELANRSKSTPERAFQKSRERKRY
jgi:hypothetical protein